MVVAASCVGGEFSAALTAARREKAWGYEHLFNLVAEPLLGYVRSVGMTMLTVSRTMC